jgi:hypothetical protein
MVEAALPAFTDAGAPVGPSDAEAAGPHCTDATAASPPPADAPSPDAVTEVRGTLYFADEDGSTAGSIVLTVDEMAVVADDAGCCTATTLAGQTGTKISYLVPTYDLSFPPSPSDGCDVQIFVVHANTDPIQGPSRVSGTQTCTRPSRAGVVTCDVTVAAMP